MPCSEPSNSDRWVARTFAGSVASSTAKPWFWLVIITRPVSRSMHRVVGAVVAELHLDGARAAREAEQLVAEADAEHRHVGLEELADRLDRVVAGLRIAGAVGEEHAVGLQRQHLVGRRLRRHHGHAAAVVGEQAQDVALDAEVVGDHVQALARAGAAGPARAPSSCPRSTGRRAAW